MVRFIDFRVIIVHGDNHRRIVARDDDVTGIIWFSRIAEEQKLRIGLLVGVFPEDFSRQDSVLYLVEGASTIIHLLRRMFGEPKIPAAYAVTEPRQTGRLLRCHGVLSLPLWGIDCGDRLSAFLSASLDIFPH